MLTIGSNIAATKTSIAGIHAFLYVAIQMHHQMILDGSYVGVIMRVAKYTVDCAVALGAPLGFGRATIYLVCSTSRVVHKLTTYNLTFSRVISFVLNYM